jgi:hypothetical protein
MHPPTLHPPRPTRRIPRAAETACAAVPCAALAQAVQSIFPARPPAGHRPNSGRSRPRARQIPKPPAARVDEEERRPQGRRHGGRRHGTRGPPSRAAASAPPAPKRITTASRSPPPGLSGQGRGGARATRHGRTVTRPVPTDLSLWLLLIPSGLRTHTTSRSRSAVRVAGRHVAAALPRMSARATCPVLVGRRGHRLSRPRPACTCTAPAPSRIHPGPCRPSVHPLLPVTPGGATRGAAATARRLPRVARGRGLVVWSLVWAGVGD